MEIIIEMALSQYLQEKDLTPVVQTTLHFLEQETTYDDPRFQPIKEILVLARTTQANETGRNILIKRLQSAYKEVVTGGICPEMKIEYDEAMKRLTE